MDIPEQKEEKERIDLIRLLRLSYSHKRAKIMDQTERFIRGTFAKAIQDNRMQSSSSLVYGEIEVIKKEREAKIRELNIEELQEIRKINTQQEKVEKPLNYKSPLNKVSDTSLKPNTQNIRKYKKRDGNSIVHQIDYEDRKVILNGKYILAEPDFNGENETFFEYIFNNQGQISKEKIEDETKIKFKKSLPDIISGLGFVGEIRKMFFPSVNKKLISFRSNLTQDMFKKIIIDKNILKKELRKLRVF